LKNKPDLTGPEIEKSKKILLNRGINKATGKNKSAKDI